MSDDPWAPSPWDGLEIRDDLRASLMSYPGISAPLWDLIPVEARSCMAPNCKPYAEVVNEFAARLEISRQLFADRPRPHQRSAKPEKVADEIAALLDAVAVLQGQISGLSAPTRKWFDAIRDGGILFDAAGNAFPTGFALFHALTTVDRTAGGLKKGLVAPPQPGGLDSKSKLAAAAVTIVAAEAFEAITGRKATPPINRANDMASKGAGPFVNFLCQVFEALDIRASARSQAAAFCKERRSAL